MKLSRRNFLGAAAVAPLAGQAAISRAAERVAGSSLAPLAARGIADPPVGGNSALKLTNFLTYAMKRDAQWRRQAKHITFLDPDLLSMRLPLTTLFRWQAERNYERIKAEEEFNFRNVVKNHGYFSWWE